MVEIYNNKQAFLNKKPKGLFIVFLSLSLILLVLVILTYKIKIYDNYQTKGIVSCDVECLITVYIPTDISFEKIEINNKNIGYEIISQEIQIDEENFVSYYKLTLKTDYKLTNEEIINLNFYYNKQRIIKKLQTNMF